MKRTHHIVTWIALTSLMVLGGGIGWRIHLKPTVPAVADVQSTCAGSYTLHIVDNRPDRQDLSTKTSRVSGDVIVGYRENYGNIGLAMPDRYIHMNDKQSYTHYMGQVAHSVLQAYGLTAVDAQPDFVVEIQVHEFWASSIFRENGAGDEVHNSDVYRRPLPEVEFGALVSWQMTISSATSGQSNSWTFRSYQRWGDLGFTVDCFTESIDMAVTDALMSELELNPVCSGGTVFHSGGTSMASGHGGGLVAPFADPSYAVPTSLEEALPPVAAAVGRRPQTNGRVPGRIERQLKAGRVFRRAKGAEDLEDYQGQRAGALIEDIVQNDPAMEVRQMALEAGRARQTAADVRAAAYVAEHDTSLALRLLAIELLSEYGDPYASRSLCLVIAHDQERPVRVAAADALIEIGDPNCGPAMQFLFDRETDTTVRQKIRAVFIAAQLAVR